MTGPKSLSKGTDEPGIFSPLRKCLLVMVVFQIEQDIGSVCVNINLIHCQLKDPNAHYIIGRLLEKS